MSEAGKDAHLAARLEKATEPKAPTVTALIPTYNRAHYVVQAVDSVLGQSRPVDEIIVVDDGSTDNTAEVLGRYGSRIRYIWRENGEAAAARNLGIREAKGDYIALLDSDDLWKPDKMKLQMKLLAEHPGIDFLFSDYSNFSDEADNEAPEIKNQEIHDYLAANAPNLTEIFDCLLVENVIPTSTVVFRKSCLERTGYFDEGLPPVEDFDLWLRAARVCRFGFVNAVVTKRRRHSGNLINQWTKLNMVYAGILVKTLNSVANLTGKSRKNLSGKIAQVHYDLGSCFLKERNFAKAYEYLRQPAGNCWNPKWLVKLMVSAALRKLPPPAKKESK
jgi:glycosyltransferase involved in cell wall biosynthesis